MDRLLAILEELRPDVDFENETNLLDGGILDSFDVIALIEEISREFEVEIDVEDIAPEKFASAETIYELIQSYL